MTDKMPDEVIGWYYCGSFIMGLSQPVPDIGDTPWKRYLSEDLVIRNDDAVLDAIEDALRFYSNRQNTRQELFGEYRATVDWEMGFTATHALAQLQKLRGG